MSDSWKPYYLLAVAKSYQFYEFELWYTTCSPNRPACATNGLRSIPRLAVAMP